MNILAFLIILCNILILFNCDWVQIGKDSQRTNRSPLKTDSKNWMYNGTFLIQDGSLVINEDEKSLMFAYFDVKDRNHNYIHLSIEDGSVIKKDSFKGTKTRGSGLLTGNYYVSFRSILKFQELGIYDNITAFDLTKEEITWTYPAVLYDHLSFCLHENIVIYSQRPELGKGKNEIITTFGAVKIGSNKPIWEHKEFVCDTNDCQFSISEDGIAYVMNDESNFKAPITQFSTFWIWKVNVKTGKKVVIEMPFKTDGYASTITINEDLYFFIQRFKRDESFHIVAMSKDTDKVVWEKQIDVLADITDYPSDIMIVDDIIYFAVYEIDDENRRTNKKRDYSWLFAYTIKGEFLFKKIIPKPGCFKLAALSNGIALSCEYWIKDADFETDIYKVTPDGAFTKKATFDTYFGIYPITDSSDNIYFCVESDSSFSDETKCFKKYMN